MNIKVIFNDYSILNVFDLEISQEEDCFAKAKLLIDSGATLPAEGVEGVIQGEEVYFRGYFVGFRKTIEGNFSEIELIACPPDIDSKIEQLQQQYRIHPYWDPLWVKDPENKDTRQDVHTSSVYCDRQNGDLRYSDWFEGEQVLSIQENFFRESLHVSLSAPPLRACTVQVHAYWIQREEGVENLSTAIRLAFPYGQVSTYTRDALVQKWPEVGQQVGRSGIWILKSKLEEIIPSTYPLYSPSVLLADQKEKLQPYRLKRHWFKPTLWVRWSYYQRRKETLSFTLLHAFQGEASYKGKHKKIEFTLQNINPDPKSYPWCPEAFYKEGSKVFYQNATYQCLVTHTAGLVFEPEKWCFRKKFHSPLGNPARSSFFLTNRGYKAAEHAIERAKALLAKSARALSITFEGPWEDLKDITTDTTVVLSDPRLPGGKWRGKVVKYALVVKGETGERFVRVTLACSIGRGESIVHAPPTKNEEAYYEEAYGSQENLLCQTVSGLSYFRYDHHSPPVRQKEGPFLRGIHLENGPDIQEEELLKFKGRQPKDLSKSLFSLSTRLSLYFKDLRTKERLDHCIPVTLAGPWTAPKQISESGNKEKELENPS